MNGWTNEHWSAVKRIMRYLKYTIDFQIIYRKTADNGIRLFGYSDADFAGCTESRKSTSGYIFMLADAPITWSTQKQSVVALSTTEAEYIALAAATKEALWLHSLLQELDFHHEAIQVHVDNQSAIKISQNPELHKRTKHIDVRFHFVREACNRGDIQVLFVSSKNQCADILTKALSKNVFHNLLKSLKIIANLE
jgi:hypothetical protein